MTRQLLFGGIAAMATFMALTPPLQAALVLDDFNYGNDSQAMNAIASPGGSGWTGKWGATTGTSTGKMFIDRDANLTYSGGGYAITQSGVGRAYGVYTAFRGINRYIDINLTGEIWFSVLLQTVTSSPVSHAGLQFNAHADAPYSGNDYDIGKWHVELVANSLQVRYNGANYPNLATLTLGQTHLIVGRLVVGAGNDTMEVWADPADLTNLGTPLFSASSADMGNAVYLGGVFAYGEGGTETTRGYIDALRISDGGGNAAQAFYDATGVVAIPEPSVAAMAAAGLAWVMMRGRRRVR